jgi:hypothetical protein
MAFQSNDRERRLELAYERLGTRTPKCQVPGCDEDDPEAFTGTFPDILCYEHRAEAEGRSWTEGDHPAGRHNDTTVVIELPGNDHRIKNGLMSEWPERTLRNPDKSPLLRMAATIRGWLNIMWIMIVRGLGWIPAKLEQLDEWLRRKQGDRWWTDPDLGWGIA